MFKKLILGASVLAVLLGMQMYANGVSGTGKNKSKKAQSRLEKWVRQQPDSLFTAVEKEDLLDDEVYLKLASEGWSTDEIVRIMETALKDKKAAKQKSGYGWYAKQWLPTIGRHGGADSLYQFIDSTYTDEIRRNIEKTVPADLLNAYYPRIDYVPKDYLNPGKSRMPGYFREAQFRPSAGRTHWLSMHPNNPDSFM